MSLISSVCVCVCSQFVKFGAFKAFEAICFSGVSRESQVSQGCSKVVPRMFKGVTRVFLKIF